MGEGVKTIRENCYIISTSLFNLKFGFSAKRAQTFFKKTLKTGLSQRVFLAPHEVIALHYGIITIMGAIGLSWGL